MLKYVFEPENEVLYFSPSPGFIKCGIDISYIVRRITSLNMLELMPFLDASESVEVTSGVEIVGAFSKHKHLCLLKYFVRLSSLSRDLDLKCLALLHVNFFLSAECK